MITKEKLSQEERILNRLEQADGQWVNGGEVFLREMYLSQYHRAIYNLVHHKERYHYSGTIEASNFTDTNGFKSYRLAPAEPTQGALFAQLPTPKL